MATDLENLNMELIQAQILLRASHELFEDILVEITRRRLSRHSGRKDDFEEEIGSRLTKFGYRDEEIRRMLSRLEKLGGQKKLG